MLFHTTIPKKNNTLVPISQKPMSSHRHSSSKRNTKAKNHGKSNNVLLFKLIDPIVQSALIVFFLFCIDTEKHFPYRTVLLFLIGWQIVSVLINFLLRKLKLLTIERLLYFVTIILYLIFFFFVERHVKEQFVPLDEGIKAAIPIRRVIVMSIGVIIAFWYTFICYREVRSLLTLEINRGKGK
jgi:hypothetical protein